MTGAALAVQTGLAAVVGVLLARESGRGPETDGFFSAYVVFVVVVLAAGAIRVTVLPAFARARLEERLGGELVAFGLVLGSVALPLLVATTVAAPALASALTGESVGLSQSTAADALPWMTLAAVCQLFAGLAASALAALDDYVTSAAAVVVGSASGLVLILALVGGEGVQAFAWGMALNGALALAIPALALAVRARQRDVPRAAARPSGAGYLERLQVLTAGAVLPLALQALYVIANRLAHGEGAGAQTSLGYAFLIVSAVVAVTASSLGLVTAVPLARAGLSPGRASRHVVASSWIALVAIGAVAGVFAVFGGRIVGGFLGSSYSSSVGDELGRLILWMSPWAVVSVGVSVTFPLVFVAGRTRLLPAIAAAVLLLQVLAAWALGRLLGLEGLALSLAVSTGAVLTALLASLGAFAATMRALLPRVAAVAVVACVAFVPAGLALPGPAAAAVGLAAYSVLVAALLSSTSLHAWRYLRALE